MAKRETTRLPKRKRRYQCPRCGKIEVRVSDRKRIKTFCQETGRDTYLAPVAPTKK